MIDPRPEGPGAPYEGGRCLPAGGGGEADTPTAEPNRLDRQGTYIEKWGAAYFGGLLMEIAISTISFDSGAPGS